MEMREIILEELEKIEKAHGVRILHAVESGSRAWGFASPDSDYDVRFIYVHPLEDYIRIDEPRDVIEWKNDGLLDINGWDLKKTMGQFARGNATLFEWSGSPAVYRTTETSLSCSACARRKPPSTPAMNRPFISRYILRSWGNSHSSRCFRYRYFAISSSLSIMIF